MIDPDEASHPWRDDDERLPLLFGEVVARVVGRRGWQRRLEEARVHAVWPDIAGPQLAAHTEPVRLHGGVLVVRADSTAWATQLRFLTGEVVRRANEALGPDEVRKVTIVTGRPTTDRGRS